MSEKGTMTPTIGRIVLYTLDIADARAINSRRLDAQNMMDWHRAIKSGAQVHVGNEVEAGEQYPAVIVRVWGGTPTAAVNLKVLLDGTDSYWASSVCEGEGGRTFAWPVRA